MKNHRKNFLAPNIRAVAMRWCVVLLFPVHAASAQQDSMPAPRAARSIRIVDKGDTEENNGRLTDRRTGAPLGDATVIARHPNGRLQLQVPVTDGLADGVWLEWYATGVPRYIADWRRGKGEGIWMYFHPTGVIRERSTLRDDRSDGPVEGWFANGAKQFEGQYARNARVGEWRFWDSTGTLLRLEKYPSPLQALDSLSMRPVPLLPVTAAFDAQHHWEFAFSRDGRSLFFATGGDSTPRQLMKHVWDSTGWQPAVALAGTQPERDGGSFVSPDGEWLYFSRNAASSPGRRDLYRVPVGRDVSIAQRLTRSALVGEVNVTLDRQGRGFLWADRRPDGRPGVTMQAVTMNANGTLRVTPAALKIPGHAGSGPNSPFIDPSGRYVIFANYGVSAGSQEDLFVAAIRDGQMQQPVSLGPLVNSPANESTPYVTPDGRFLLFSSDRAVPNGQVNRSRIFVIPITAVPTLQAIVQAPQ